MSNGSVITFYSYKGGVGRSFLLANVGAQLAIWGYRVLLVDWDLEAPGIHLYFDSYLDKPIQNGLLELIEDESSSKSPDWRNYLTEVNTPQAKVPLQLLSAGCQDDSYIGRVQKIDWEKLYADQDLGNFLEKMRNEWKEEFDFILIDSRTGITDTGGICTVQMPDILTLVFTSNHQNLNGVIDVSRKVIDQRNRLPFDRPGLMVLPIPSRIDSRDEYKLTDEWMNLFAKKLEFLYENWIDKTINVIDLLNYTRVPYFTYWSFGEKLPIVEESAKNPDGISYYIATISALIARKLADNSMLLSEREVYLSQAEIEENERSDKLRVFIDYPQSIDSQNIDIALRLSEALSENGMIVFPNKSLVKHFSTDNYKSMTNTRNLLHANIIILLMQGAPGDSLKRFLARSIIIEMRKMLISGTLGVPQDIIPVILPDFDGNIKDMIPEGFPIVDARSFSSDPDEFIKQLTESIIERIDQSELKLR